MTLIAKAMIFWSLVLFFVPLPVFLYFYAGSVGDPVWPTVIAGSALFYGMTGLSAVAVRLWECFLS